MYAFKMATEMAAVKTHIFLMGTITKVFVDQFLPNFIYALLLSIVWIWILFNFQFPLWPPYLVHCPLFFVVWNPLSESDNILMIINMNVLLWVSKVQTMKTLIRMLHNNTFWRLWNIMYLKILWKMELMLLWSKCSIFHIFKSIQNLTWIFLEIFQSCLKIEYDVMI